MCKIEKYITTICFGLSMHRSNIDWIIITLHNQNIPPYVLVNNFLECKIFKVYLAFSALFIKRIKLIFYSLSPTTFRGFPQKFKLKFLSHLLNLIFHQGMGSMYTATKCPNFKFQKL